MIAPFLVLFFRIMGIFYYEYLRCLFCLITKALDKDTSVLLGKEWLAQCTRRSSLVELSPLYTLILGRYGKDTGQDGV
jgi:hypothetical protein